MGAVLANAPFCTRAVRGEDGRAVDVAPLGGLDLHLQPPAAQLGCGRERGGRGTSDGTAVGQPLHVIARRRLPAADRRGEWLPDPWGAVDAGPGPQLDLAVVEVDEAARPAAAALREGAPVEVPAPAVLGDHDLPRGEDLLDVGHVAARSDATGVPVPPGHGPHHRLLVGDPLVRAAPVVGHAGARPRTLGGHAALDQAVGHVVGAVVAGVHPPPHLLARLAVAEVGVALVLAAGVAGAQVRRRRRCRRGERHERHEHRSDDQGAAEPPSPVHESEL